MRNDFALDEAGSFVLVHVLCSTLSQGLSAAASAVVAGTDSMKKIGHNLYLPNSWTRITHWITNFRYNQATFVKWLPDTSNTAINWKEILQSSKAQKYFIKSVSVHGQLNNCQWWQSLTAVWVWGHSDNTSNIILLKRNPCLTYGHFLFFLFDS